MVDGKIIEGRNEQDGEGEWNSGKTHLSCLDSTSVRNSDNCGAEKVVCCDKKVRQSYFVKLTLHAVRIGIVWLTSRGVWAKTALLLEEVLGLLRLRFLQIVHLTYL